MKKLHRFSKIQLKAQAALDRVNSGEVEVLPATTKKKISIEQSRELDEHVEQIGELNSRIDQKLRDVKYDVIEFGWRLMRLKEIVGHGNFMDWVKETWPKLEHRTATNYINAAANAKLNAQSKLETVSNLREIDKYKNKLLTDLYKSPKRKTKTATLELPNPDRGVDKENRAAKASMAFQRIVDVMDETKILWTAMSAAELKDLAKIWTNGLQIITQRKVVLGEPL
jgi:hypothetical protein